MILRVTEDLRAAFLKACGHEHVFGSKCRALFLAYGEASGVVLFWTDARENASCAMALMQGVLVVSTDGRTDTGALAAFIRAQHVKEVDTTYSQCAALQEQLGGECESSFYMVYEGSKIVGEYGCISTCSGLKPVYDVLVQSHEYYRTHLNYETWAADLRCRLSKGLSELYCLTQDGAIIGTGSIASEDNEVGVIAAVAVIPEYRGRGLGTKISEFLVNRILEKGKRPMLISGYDAVARLYRRVGFTETGRWGELYL